MNAGRCGEFQVACFAGGANWGYFVAPLISASITTDVTFSSAHDRSRFHPRPIICGRKTTVRSA